LGEATGKKNLSQGKDFIMISRTRFTHPSLSFYEKSLDLSTCEKGGKRFKNLSANGPSPILTIVTIVFNGARYLEEAIKSVVDEVNGSPIDVEYVIVDGGSTDGTLDIIREYEEYIDLWLSQKDKGIYDAFNKGIALAKGEIVKLVNADDLLSKNSIQTACSTYSQLNSARIALSSDLVIIDKYGKYDSTWYFSNKGKLFPNFLHPSWYISKNIYHELGLYCTEFKISADYEYYLHLQQNGIKFVQSEKPLACFRLSGASNSLRGVVEVFKINNRYFGPITAIRIMLKHAFIKIMSRLFRYILGRNYHLIKSLFFSPGSR
jgi:glycosyltransferase involved in cell wall biosynthesis